MRQHGNSFSLSLKPRQLLRSGMPSGKDHLDSDDAIQRNLAGTVNDTHSAPTKLPENVISLDKVGHHNAGLVAACAV